MFWWLVLRRNPPLNCRYLFATNIFAIRTTTTQDSFSLKLSQFKLIVDSIFLLVSDNKETIADL